MIVFEITEGWAAEWKDGPLKVTATGETKWQAAQNLVDRVAELGLGETEKQEQPECA